MKPVHLIGMPYRLGAETEKNGAVDCLHLAKTVLANYGIKHQSLQKIGIENFVKENIKYSKKNLKSGETRQNTVR